MAGETRRPGRSGGGVIDEALGADLIGAQEAQAVPDLLQLVLATSAH
jgi:hypothetical protein